MTLNELAEAFLAANKNRLSPNTLRAYGYDLGLLARELPDITSEEVTIAHLRAFLQATAELTPSTLARRQATLRACFAWAYKNDLLPADPTVKLEPVRLPERDPRPLTAEHRSKPCWLPSPTAEKRNRLLFSLLYETGIRVGEALGILVPHVHLNEVDGGYIRVIGKGDRERIVPLIDAPRTVRLLRETLKSLSAVGPLFRGDPRKGGSAGEALDYTTLYYHFERYLEIVRQKKPALFPVRARNDHHPPAASHLCDPETARRHSSALRSQTHGAQEYPDHPALCGNRSGNHQTAVGRSAKTPPLNLFDSPLSSFQEDP